MDNRGYPQALAEVLPPSPLGGDARLMTTTETTASPHAWKITAIGSADRPHATGSALDRTEAWTQALTAGRTALLTGALDTLAVTIDGHREAIYDPGRDEHGTLDPAQVTAALVDLHQAVTSGDLATRIAAGHP